MPHSLNEKVLTVHFFKTPAGNEPVREWLKLRTTEEKKAIGEDIKAVEYSWPVGYPQVTKLDNESITSLTLKKAATVLGKKLRLELV
jgi:hypothetical protein